MALAEVLKDLQGSGILPDTQARIHETKVGVTEALIDTGVADKQQKPATPKGVNISFKDLPPSGKVQAAAQQGMQLDPKEVLVQEAQKLAETMIKDKGQQVKGVKKE